MKASPLYNPSRRLIALIASQLHRRRLVRLLKGAGYRVQFFSNSTALSKFLTISTPAAVLVELTFSDGNSLVGRDLVRKLRKRFRGSFMSPAVVCISPIWSVQRQEEILREGAAFAWLSDRGEILRAVEYAIYMRSSTSTPCFRIIVENLDGGEEIGEESRLKSVALLEKDGSESRVFLTTVPLLVFVYLLLRNGSVSYIQRICEEMNSMPFYYDAGTKVRDFTYAGIKEELYRIKRFLRKFLKRHGYSFGKVWLEEAMDGDERTSGIRINAGFEIE